MVDRQGARRPQAQRAPRAALALVGALLVSVVAACGSGSGAPADDVSDAAIPTVAVTTSVLGDVVERALGDAAEVSVVIPAGASPHEFQPSARDVATITSADAVVAVGRGFEEGLSSALEVARDSGVTVVEAAASLPESPEVAVDEHDGGHFFTDPVLMSAAIAGVSSALVDAVPELDAQVVEAATDAVIEDLAALDAEISEILAVVAEPQRKLVTDHEVLGPFAARYGFEIVGVVVPGGSTHGATSGGDLDELVGVLTELGLPALFTESSAPGDVVAALAADAGVEVVTLFAESLGPEGSGAETYRELLLTDARRIAEALG